MESYWYLSTPFAAFEGGTQAAFALARAETRRLAVAGVRTYCPVSATYPMARARLSVWSMRSYWYAADRPLMDGAQGLILLFAPGWMMSAAMAHEIAVFERARKPIVPMIPGRVPASLRRA